MEQIHIVKERISAPTDASARREAVNSKNTVAVAAVATAGAKMLEYTRVIEDTPSGPQSVVTFALQEGFLEFRPDFAAENIAVGEAMRRLRDDAWLAANPHHPLTFMAYALEAYKRLTRAIRENSPLLCIERGKKKLFLNVRGDRDYQRRLMQKAGITDAEADAIIAQLEAGK